MSDLQSKDNLKTYIATKILNALPMSRAAYNSFRGWKVPADEDGNDEGYLVEYRDGGKANTKTYSGYISWSPKEPFEKAYKTISGLDFGDAINALKLGCKVARKGWNGKGMWLVLVPGTPEVFLREGTPYQKALPNSTVCEILPHIDMWTTNSEGRRAMLCGWLASQTDMLSEDWEIVE